MLSYGNINKKPPCVSKDTQGENSAVPPAFTRNSLAFISAVTPRLRFSLPLTIGSKERLQSEMEIFLPFRIFQPTNAVSLKGGLKNTCFFIAFDLISYIIIYAPRKNVKRFFTAKRNCANYLFFKRSLISSKRRVFAVAFASSAAFAAAASSAAFAAAAASAAAFSALNASTFAS